MCIVQHLFIYYTHFEITGGPCNVIGSNWCSLSHHFLL